MQAHTALLRPPYRSDRESRATRRAYQTRRRSRFQEAVLRHSRFMKGISTLPLPVRKTTRQVCSPKIRMSPPAPPHKPVSPCSYTTEMASTQAPLRTTRRTTLLGGLMGKLRAAPPPHGPNCCLLPSDQNSLKPSRANPATIWKIRVAQNVGCALAETGPAASAHLDLHELGPTALVGVEDSQEGWVLRLL